LGCSRARRPDPAVDGLPPGQAAAEGDGTPLLALAGFNGPLALLLTLVRARQIDLRRLSLPGLIDQLSAALHLAAPMTALSQKGDWVVMTAWLVLLRSRLLLTGDTRAQAAAEAEAGHLRQRLVALDEVQAFAAWLDRRPRLGHDVFARGRPEFIGTMMGVALEIDVIAFLWASMALFEDDGEAVDTASLYRPPWLDLYSIPDAHARILRLMADAPGGQPLDRFLPDMPPRGGLWRRSAWTSVFAASLELAKQGTVALAQGDAFSPIQVIPGRNS
jgi:segregation and condensation protein A